MARILLVDDDESLRKVLRRALVTMGHVVVEAGNGEDALAAHGREPVDVVLTDLVMPEKEGIETIREFRLMYPNIGIVAMSGGGRAGSEGYLTLAMAMGADRVLPKPFALSMMGRAIAEVLEEPPV